MPYSKTISICCHVCQLPKKGNTDKFRVRKLNRDGLMGTCKKCLQKYMKKYDQKPARVKKVRERNYLKRYGLTLSQYNQLFDSQDGKCAICKTKGLVSKVHLHVDHCHSTNKIRGLLCSKCNLMLGQGRDNIRTLENAISYLERQNH